MRVVHGLDAERIARDDETTRTSVPERHPEHPLEALEEVLPVLLVEVNDDFGIAVRGEPMALADQFVAQLLEVVDLSVADDDAAAVLVRNWLVTASDVDDRQPPHTERERAIDELPGIVGTAMKDRVPHPAKHVRPGAAFAV